MNTIDHLLKPRYLVIADYPLNEKFKVGSILEFFAATDESGIVYFYHHDLTHQNFQDTYFAQYPHLFRPLAWWEQRKIEEMPEYVKHNGEIIKVGKWDLKDSHGWIAEAGRRVYHRDVIIPATKEEYEIAKDSINQ